MSDPAPPKDFTPDRLKLNLGCNRFAKPGYINIDQEKLPGVDLVTDLNKPWPWEDGSVDFIRASNVFEHLQGPDGIPGHVWCMNEAYRVLRPGGELDVEVPSMAGPGGVQDPTHVTFWNENSFLYYQMGAAHWGQYYPWLITAAFDINVEITPPEPVYGVIFIQALCRKPSPEELEKYAVK